jgi:hypothetical protein
MRNGKITTVSVGLTVLLSGCETMMETMFTHIVLNETLVAHIATGNALVNFCLANNAIDKNTAYAFNNVSAQLLDITVIDRNFYKSSYSKAMDEVQNLASRSSSSEIRAECSKGERELPPITERLTNTYMQFSRELAMARAQERQQMATMLTNFGKNWSQQSYPTMYGWPTVKYVEAQAQPASVNYLVNTSNGLIQCRTTNKNYVFCM